MNDLEQLKTLLFGAERQALDSITERVQRRETRAADVAEVLPEAVRLSHQQGEELVATLREPVGDCLRDAFRREPERYADAMYPVMGPAIRKSIMNALRAFAQQINETIEQSLSARGVKWRFEAWRSGIPFGEFVVQRTLLYRVEQAYLISRENGLLIGHVHHRASSIKDSDAVSAMFTAIQDFIKESFSPDRTGRLETADMGEFTLWAVHGPHALLVCVIRGVPPRSLRADLSAILERVHFRYADAIREYAGDTATLEGVEEDLADCLRFEAMQPRDPDRRRSRLPLVVMLLLAGAAVAYLGLRSWQDANELRSLEDAAAATPGWYVDRIEREDDTYVIHGLRDPLAASAGEIAAIASLPADRVTAEVRPFQSLEPAIVLHRVRAVLLAPATVNSRIGDGRIVLEGEAPVAWLRDARARTASASFGLPVSLDAVTPSELRQLETDVAALQEARFTFVAGTELAGAEAVRLEQHAAAIGRLARDASRLDRSLQVTVIGQTDPVGNADDNRQLAGRRAALVRQQLLANEVPEHWISREAVIGSGAAGAPNVAERSATILLGLRAPAATTGHQPPR